MGEHETAHSEDLRLQLVVLRCQSGDDTAFARLYEWFAERSLRYLRGLVGDAADDLQQEVWLSVYRSIASLAKPSAFRTWLFSTTRRRALDFLRKAKRERELLEDVVEEMREEVAEGPELRAGEAMDVAMKELSVAHREVVFLRYRDDMSYGEIALVLGVPIGTVRTRLHHAKRRLHELLT